VRQVGTPEELYARPAHSDVAEFMGYRNLLRSQVSEGGKVTVGGASFRGTPIEQVADGKGVVAIRPDDLRATPNGPLTATVESAQYHGDCFYCSGKSADGSELFFVSPSKAQKGASVRLAAEPDRVLIYAS
jgi:putative spermidine/putrescine transport system ATP-binding protein